MMKNLKVMACDNPSCDTVLEAGDGPGPDGAPGYYIDRGSRHDGWGGGGFAKVFACRTECVGPAIDAVFNEGWDNGAIRKKW
ncbi:hypothetical protein ANMWB30_23950 [Arthrobacter sp. MWB30]|nr:hypothetical protein ANMWB30_23950 [Arthrobacter sp. MWB30]